MPRGLSSGPQRLGPISNPPCPSSCATTWRRHSIMYGDGNLDHYRDYGLVAVDPAEPDRPVARAFSVPFAFPDPARGREALPRGGWDQVIRGPITTGCRASGPPPSARSKSWSRRACKASGYRGRCSRRCVTTRVGTALPSSMRQSVRPKSRRGLSFEKSGIAVVPGALSPVQRLARTGSRGLCRA